MIGIAKVAHAPIHADLEVVLDVSYPRLESVIAVSLAVDRVADARPVILAIGRVLLLAKPARPGAPRRLFGFIEAVGDQIEKLRRVSFLLLQMRVRGIGLAERAVPRQHVAL